jgi:hypothetical protein
MSWEFCLVQTSLSAGNNLKASASKTSGRPWNQPERHDFICTFKIVFLFSALPIMTPFQHMPNVLENFGSTLPVSHTS